MIPALFIQSLRALSVAARGFPFCLFAVAAQKKKKGCTQEERISLKRPALLITTTFVWSDTRVYCLFFLFCVIFSCDDSGRRAPRGGQRRGGKPNPDHQI